MVRVARIEDTFYTVDRAEAAKGVNGVVKGEGQGGEVVHVEEWPKSRALYHSAEWLEWYGCEHAEWRNPTEFY